ncbi:MAG: shikimate kinase [Methanofollis sp.]|uniref:shikimate kinase n=1 Tax=Methanofollis sp. TaxID=2052835 RepID=UPI00261E9045|nr:shikimate kinase [Methanofollis sp.]MDD4254740.1 shikimate kinase [Methanofollis sp.]
MKVVLIGYRGAGKTTVGMMVARRLSLPFLDTDALVEERAGISIPAIFATAGEAAFRSLEREVIAGLADFRGVIATGGGAVLDPENVAALRRGGTAVLLEADPEEVITRTAASDRPSLTGLPPEEEVRALLRTRRPFYLAAADICAGSGGRRPDRVADEIIANLAGRPGPISLPVGFSLPPGETERLAALGPATGLYGIAGHPALHSRSPLLYNALFARYGMDARYTFFDHPDFGAVLDTARSLGVRGLSVTIPHKEAALAAADEADRHAAAIGAANTLVLCGDHVRASNTDWAGVRRPLEGVAAERAVVLGAGGAAAAAVYALLSLEYGVTVLARDAARAEALAARFGCESGAIRDIGRFRPEVVVHATPVGMAGDPRSLLAPEDLRPGTTIFDLVYTPKETPLLRTAAARGCRTIPGTEMFVYQACEQFLHMTGIRVEDRTVREVLGE